ncbi:thiamineS protein [Caldicellulosiruptor kronotskyensis 2002]|uniref:ThiamineS protein n=1 Tax=Caldicellulosiruptor kronotskyensis (strain DSM 18902 / VKM B-2412 / 2002) TaxID=632348 RepID=E4SHH4_CALK2|nr:MoaD/ThiS family protein [Caldicellulosiruptor kronotskyensis]ADQ47199.1 thiamineS protein [Caldicellulosiruptor kronotskyensis 2002]
MKIIFVGKNKEVEVKGPKTVINLAKELNINLESNVFIKNGEIVAPDDVLNDSDTVEIISAVSGG